MVALHGDGRRGRPPEGFLDPTRVAHPLAMAIHQLIEQLPEIESVTGLARRIAPDLDEGWLSGTASGRELLSDQHLERLVLFAGWTPEQKRLLLRADNRSQARANRRRTKLYPPVPETANELVAIGALNFDQTIPLPTVVGEGDTRRHAATVFSYDPETRVASEEELEEYIRDVQRRIEANGDVFERALGGSSYNMMQTLAWAQLDLPLSFVGVSGRVPRSWPAHPRTKVAYRNHRAELKDAGVDCSLLPENDRTGGRCASVVSLHGDEEVQRMMLTWPGANVELADHLGACFWGVVDLLAQAHAIHVTSLFDPESPAVLADLIDYVTVQRPEILVSFDPGHVWATAAEGVDVAAVSRLLSRSRILFVNETELEALARKYADYNNPLAQESDFVTALLAQMSRISPTLVVVKHRGAASVYLSGGESVRREIPPLSTVDIVDDTGAGDAFAAGYLGALLTGRDVAGCADQGLRLARAKIQTSGLIPPGDVPLLFRP